jgi:hypothetical protein
MDRQGGSREPLLWLRNGRAIPASSARHGLADHPPPGTDRSSSRALHLYRAGMARSPWEVADGDGMTHPGQQYAYAPLGKPSGKSHGKDPL